MSDKVNTAATNTAATNTDTKKSNIAEPAEKRPNYSQAKVGQSNDSVTTGKNTLPDIDPRLKIEANGKQYSLTDFFNLSYTTTTGENGATLYIVKWVPNDKAKDIGFTERSIYNVGETADNTIPSHPQSLPQYGAVVDKIKADINAKLTGSDVPDVNTDALSYVPEDLTKSADPLDTYKGGSSGTGTAFANDQKGNSEKYHNELIGRTTDDEHLKAMDPHYQSTFMNEWRDEDGDGQPDNFNGMTFNATRNLARAADRLNNREWWNGGEAGAYSARNGTVSGSNGYAYKKQPIQTWETRQMDKMNKLDERRIQHDIDRAAKVLDWSVDARMMSDKQELDVIKGILDGDQDFANKIRDAIVEIQMTNPDHTRQQEILHRFIQNVDINNKAYYYNQIMQIFQNEGFMAAIMYSALCHGFTQIDPEQYFMSKIIPEYMKNNPEAGPQEALLEFYRAYVDYTSQCDIINTKLAAGEITEEQAEEQKKWVWDASKKKYVKNKTKK